MAAGSPPPPLLLLAALSGPSSAVSVESNEEALEEHRLNSLLVDWPQSFRDEWGESSCCCCCMPMPNMPPPMAPKPDEPAKDSGVVGFVVEETCIKRK
jgi:hypothetical protein